MSESKKAGVAEERISAATSERVFGLLLADASMSGSLLGTSAVISGALDGLARFMAGVQITDTSAKEMVESIAPHLEVFLERRMQLPQGEA